jgi:adenylate cyclase
MSIEIERKFLLKNDSWRFHADNTPIQGFAITQGYLANGSNCSVRIRTTAAKAFVTIKGPGKGSKGVSRSEYEYEIPLSDAEAMLQELAQRPFIEKIRYKIEYKNMLWEVDEFKGENSGLIMAEVELANENQQLALPPWIGQEVTGDIRYYNAHLVNCPFSKW